MAAGQPYKGKNLRIFVDGETVFHATECSFNSSIQLEEVATKDTQGSLVVDGNYSWGLSTNMLVADKAALSTQEDYKGLLQKHKSGTQVEVQFTTDLTGDLVISGNAYIESISITAPTQGFATAECSLKGSGDYTVGTVS